MDGGPSEREWMAAQERENGWRAFRPIPRPIVAATTAPKAPVHAACPCARLVCRKCAGVASSHPDPSPCFACGRPSTMEFSSDQCRPDFGVLAALAGRCSTSDTSVPLQHVVCVLFGALLPPVVSTFVSMWHCVHHSACSFFLLHVNRAVPILCGRAGPCAQTARTLQRMGRPRCLPPSCAPQRASAACESATSV